MGCTAELNDLMKVINRKFRDQRKRFEQERDHLTAKLENADKGLKERDVEIASLRRELLAAKSQQLELEKLVVDQNCLVRRMESKLHESLNSSVGSGKSIAATRPAKDECVGTEEWDALLERELTERIEAFAAYINGKDDQSRVGRDPPIEASVLSNFSRRGGNMESLMSYMSAVRVDKGNEVDRQSISITDRLEMDRSVVNQNSDLRSIANWNSDHRSIANWNSDHHSIADRNSDLRSIANWNSDHHSIADRNSDHRSIADRNSDHHSIANWNSDHRSIANENRDHRSTANQDGGHRLMASHSGDHQGSFIDSFQLQRPASSTPATSVWQASTPKSHRRHSLQGEHSSRDRSLLVDDTMRDLQHNLNPSFVENDLLERFAEIETKAQALFDDDFGDVDNATSRNSTVLTNK